MKDDILKLYIYDVLALNGARIVIKHNRSLKV